MSKVLSTARVKGRRLLDDYRKLRATQIVLSRELGMTPEARMAIKASSANAAVDLVSLTAQTEDPPEKDPPDDPPAPPVEEPEQLPPRKSAAA